jgi:hypothetical protein
VNAAHNLIATQGPAEERADRTESPASARKNTDRLRNPAMSGRPQG